MANKLLPVLSALLDEKIKVMSNKSVAGLVFPSSGTHAQNTVSSAPQFQIRKDRGIDPSFTKALKRPADHLGQVFEGTDNSESGMVELSDEEL